MNESSWLPGPKQGQFRRFWQSGSLSFPRLDSIVTLPSPTRLRAGESSRVSSLIDQEPMDLSALWFPTAPEPPPSGTSAGRWAVSPFGSGSLGRACPAPRLCSRGAASGSPLVAATLASQQRARRSGPAVPSLSFPAPSSTRVPALLPALWQLSGLSAWQAGSALPGPGSDRGGSVAGGRESEVGAAYSRPEDPHLRPGAGFQAAGGARQVCGCCARAEDAAWCVPSCLRVCACARRGDGARAGRAAPAARRRGGGGGLGPDGDGGRRRCRSTGGDSHRD